MRARMWMTVVCLLAGCAPEAGVGTAALSGPHDCRLDDSCEGFGASAPLEAPFVVPALRDVPKFEGDFVEVETLEVYREDPASWQRGAAGFAARNEAIFGVATFAPGEEPGTHGAAMLWTTAIASREEPSRALFPAEEGDVPALLALAQAHARGRGYEAALPAYERVENELGRVESVVVLANDAVEVRFVDVLALGVRDVRDVPAVFAGADRFAFENGYATGIPTFEVLTDGDRTAIGVILVSAEHAYPLDLPDFEIILPPEGCGRPGQPCCQSFCEAGTICRFGGLVTHRDCLPLPDPTAPYCGNGRCDPGEACSCVSDCGNRCMLCAPNRVSAYCVSCPGELPRTAFFTNCTDPLTLADGCVGRRGTCR